MLKLDGKKIVVIGGSGDIGHAIVEGFIMANAEVMVVDMVFDSLKDDKHKNVRQCRVDLVNISEAVSIFERELKNWGGCDVLVYMAALNLHKDMKTMDVTTWNKVQDVNVTAAFFMSRAAANFMRGNQGRIILVSSCSAVLAYTGFPDYVVSKGAIEALTRTLAVELASSGITVNAIAPGTTKTRMTRALWENPEKLAAHQATIPLGRIAETKDHVGPVLFFASDLSKYVTGTILPVDGGLRVLQADFINLKLRGEQ